MKKLSALALAAALGLSSLAPIASVEAATAKSHSMSHSSMGHKKSSSESKLICHKVKEKDGKMHTLCHHQHHHMVEKKAAKKK